MGILERIAVGVAVTGISALMYGHHVIQGNFKNEQYYKKSMEILKTYPPALKLLGEPIKVKYLDIFNHVANCSDGKDAKLTIPVKGPKNRGELRLWASRTSYEHEWLVERCDLHVGKKEWTFYINPDSPTKHKPIQENVQTWTSTTKT